VTHAFPAPAVLATLDPADLPMPRARGATLVALATALASGDLELGEGADRARSVAGLLALPGVGPWTAGYIAMRALRDPDAYPAGDLGVRRALERLGVPDADRSLERRGEPWRPYRAYATQYLWAELAAPAGRQAGTRRAPGGLAMAA
jgi:AraC family transcriptional regulator of adaptative response / DNA-3-methyladenine glycosylase II